MASVDTEQLATGTRFGSYVIVRRLGKGSYGSVYEALRQPLNRRVALKLLHRQMTTQEQTVARFIREAELVASLEHPHIVGVFDVGTFEEVPFLAMEFLEGQSLGDRLKRDVALAVTETTDLLLPIFSAVATVHERGIVHRDLKPDNILLANSVTGEVTPKLLDFGIAKVEGSDNALTRTNALMGTPFYMSPEQAKESKHIDARTDQWALGVIAWQCVAGRRPFRGNSLLDVLSAVAHGPIEPLRLIVPEVPSAFERAVLGALQRDPSMRYPTVWDFGWQLLPFASPMTQMKWREHFRARLSEAPDASGASSVSLDLSDAGFSATDRSVPPSMSVPPSAQSLPPPTARSTPSPESSASFPAGLAAASISAPSRPTLPRPPSSTDSVGTLEPRALTLPAAAPPRRPRTPLLVAIGVTALVGAAVIGGFALRSPAPQAATVAAT
jgi:serine/threonine-protein kinase